MASGDKNIYAFLIPLFFPKYFCPLAEKGHAHLDCFLEFLLSQTEKNWIPHNVSYWPVQSCIYNPDQPLRPLVISMPIDQSKG